MYFRTWVSVCRLKMGRVNWRQIINPLFMMERELWVLPNRQNCRKGNVEECIFDYMALHIKCRFNKNSLLQSYFLASLPVVFVDFILRIWNINFPSLNCFSCGFLLVLIVIRSIRTATGFPIFVKLESSIARTTISTDCVGALVFAHCCILCTLIAINAQDSVIEFTVTGLADTTVATFVILAKTRFRVARVC